MRDFQLRLSQIIKEEAARLISQKIAGGLFLTVTSVSANDDGTQADIYYIVYPETAVNSTKCKNILEINKSEIQRSISEKHRLRKTPRLNFYYDNEYAKMSKIDEALNIINDERSKV